MHAGATAACAGGRALAGGLTQYCVSTPVQPGATHPASATSQPALLRAAWWSVVHASHASQGKAGQARNTLPQSFSSAATQPLKPSRWLVHWLLHPARLVELRMAILGPPLHPVDSAK
jgi:hypothetical protein